eukprot:scaffold67917_cov63-Phaeocystis_antarctica.AAC.2
MQIEDFSFGVRLGHSERTPRRVWPPDFAMCAPRPSPTALALGTLAPGQSPAVVATAHTTALATSAPPLSRRTPALSQDTPYQIEPCHDKPPWSSAKC